MNFQQSTAFVARLPAMKAIKAEHTSRSKSMTHVCRLYSKKNNKNTSVMNLGQGKWSGLREGWSKVELDH